MECQDILDENKEHFKEYDYIIMSNNLQAIFIHTAEADTRLHTYSSFFNDISGSDYSNLTASNRQILCLLRIVQCLVFVYAVLLLSSIFVFTTTNTFFVSVFAV